MYQIIRKYMKYWAVLGALVISLLTIAGCGTSASSAGSASNGGSNSAAATQVSDSNGKAATGTLDVMTLDIGQGDAHLIKVGDNYTLIDTGDVDHRDSIVAQLKALHVTTLKNVIITHPHSDHLGGFVAIANAGIKIEHVYDNGMDYSSSVYRRYVKTVNRLKIPRDALFKGAVLDLGNGATFTVYAPWKDGYINDKKGHPDPNNNSIVGKLVFGKFSELFTGDASRDEENRLIKEENTKLSSRVLKVGHHGSGSSSQTDFLRSVRPEIGVISEALHNDYGHPNPQTMKRLAAEHITVYQTATQGRITIHTDGKTWNVTTEK